MAEVYGLRDKQAKQAGGGIFARDEGEIVYHTGGTAQRDPIPMNSLLLSPPLLSAQIRPRLSHHSKFVFIVFYSSCACMVTR